MQKAEQANTEGNQWGWSRRGEAACGLYGNGYWKWSSECIEEPAGEVQGYFSSEIFCGHGKQRDSEGMRYQGSHCQAADCQGEGNDWGWNKEAGGECVCSR